MKTLKKIDPMSAARVATVLGIIWGLVTGVGVLMLGTGMEAYMGRFYTGYSTMMPMVAGVAAIVILPIAYAVTGFIGAYIGALVYNFVAEKVGGVKIDL